MLGQWSLTYQENNDLTFIQKLLKKNNEQLYYSHKLEFSNLFS